MTTETNKTLNILESIKSIAIGLIGAGIAGKGITYFSPRLSYDIPRILFPVYKAFGHTGLAIGMIVLGVLLLTWSYFRWKSNKGKPAQWVLIAGVLSVAVIGVMYATGSGIKKGLSEESLSQSTQAAVDTPTAVEVGPVSFPPSFSSESKQQYEQLIRELEDAIRQKDKSKSWTTYNKVNLFTADLKPDQNDPQQLQFIVAQTRKMDQYSSQIKSFAGSN